MIHKFTSLLTPSFIPLTNRYWEARMRQALGGFPGPAVVEGVGRCGRQILPVGPGFAKTLRQETASHIWEPPTGPRFGLWGSGVRDEAKRPGWWRPHRVLRTMLGSEFMGRPGRMQAGGERHLIYILYKNSCWQRFAPEWKGKHLVSNS